MSVVSYIDTPDAPAHAVSTGATAGARMDKVVARRTIGLKARIGIGVAVLIALGVLAWWFMPASNSQTVETQRLTISTAQRGTFDDFIPLRGRVEPSLTIYLDAVEGGRVEQVLVEDGAMVQQGQLLAVLSNSDLQLNVLARQTEVTQQINSMRSQELALQQTRLNNERALIEAELQTATARRQYEMQRPLADRGFVSGRAIADSRDAYDAARRRSDVLRRARTSDERLQSQQLAQLRASATGLNSSLDIARTSLDSLNVRAPATGQITAFQIQVGQSLQRGVRLGQIDSAGNNKLVAQVDEFYLGRVREGQTGTAEVGGRQVAVRVNKIYPQVTNGTFTVDLVFAGPASEVSANQLQRGQSIQVRLTLGGSSEALMVPNGGFVTETGGNWVFVVGADGNAERRQVRLGRRNTNYVEVLEGLEPGDRVITSSYTGFAERDRLQLSR